jgi:hypothetical protein
MFFELELQAVPEAVIDPLLGEPLLANFLHHIHVSMTTV